MAVSEDKPSVEVKHAQEFPQLLLRRWPGELPYSGDLLLRWGDALGGDGVAEEREGSDTELAFSRVDTDARVLQSAEEVAEMADVVCF